MLPLGFPEGDYYDVLCVRAAERLGEVLARIKQLKDSKSLSALYDIGRNLNTNAKAIGAEGEPFPIPTLLTSTLATLKPQDFEER